MKARTAILAAVLTAAAVTASAGAASARILPGLPGLSAFPTSATAITMISNDPDNGHGNPPVWATDSIMRTVTVTRGEQVPGTDCNLAASATCWSYTMSLRDSGSFVTIPGAGTPNQSCTGCAGEHIARQVSGSIDGTYTVSFNASSGSPDGMLVPLTHNDHGVAGSPPFTSTTWGELFFPGGTSFGGSFSGPYSWTYTVAFPREQWVDASTNNDGSTTGPGNNITG